MEYTTLSHWLKLATRQKAKLTLLVIGFTACSVQANHSCTGKVTNLHVNKNGQVYVSATNIASNSYICRLQDMESEQNVISGEVCKVMYSTLMTAKIANKNVTFYFTNDDHACSKGDWENLYKDHGFYHLILK